MMAVAVQTEPTFGAETPRLLFKRDFALEFNASGATNYDVTADGQQFLMIRPVVAPAQRINIVLNFFEELKERVPVP